MVKPKKIQYNGDSKVLIYACSCINWVIDNIQSVAANPQDTATDTLTKIEIDGTVYNVSASPQNIDADDVSYDNTQSGLTADDLQGAVDEIVADLGGKADSSLIGANNGIAELDSSGKVPSSQLPSYVDDVVEYASISSFPSIGESGKIYVALDTNLSYRWGGSSYVEISPSLALGETSTTAYRGDRGKSAYDHATDSSRLTTSQLQGLYKIGVTDEGHVSSATAVQKSDITGLGIPAQDTTYSNGDGLNLNGTAFSVNTVFSDLQTRTNIASGDSFATILGKIKKFFADLKTVAFSGSYNDLTDKPTLGTASEKDVPISGNASASQVVMGNDTRLTDARPASDVYSWAKQSTKPSYTANEVGLGNVPNVSTNDQTPTFTQASTRENIASGEKLSVILGKIMKFFSDLNTIAFSGSYNDLSDKPTIPTVNNGTLTIQKNGSNVAAFTANQSENGTANIIVPTKTSDLTNDSGFITENNLPFVVIDGKLCVKYVKE